MLLGDPEANPLRCDYGPRLPLIVISPWVRSNYVDHTVTDQTSVLRFIEDNWNLGRLGDAQWTPERSSVTPPGEEVER